MEDLTETASRGDASKLIAQIERERGLDLSQYRLSYVERRLGTRLRAPVRLLPLRTPGGVSAPARHRDG
jgi:hypothetical protein